jgi:hypothetical protein
VDWRVWRLRRSRPGRRENPYDGNWHFFLTPYLWRAGFKGDPSWASFGLDLSFLIMIPKQVLARVTNFTKQIGCIRHYTSLPQNVRVR